jgi:predicted component of type VI protein secretion system
MITLPITEKAKKHEWKNILNIAQKNGFPINIIHDVKKKEIAKQKNK